MTTRHNNKIASKGFTLIEVIIYTALTALILGSAIAVAYQIMASSGQLQTKIHINAEANFILQKIQHALVGLPTIVAPAAGNTDTALEIINYGQTLRFALSGTNITLQRDSNPSIILNSGRIPISALAFEHIASVNGKPEAIKTTIAVKEVVFESITYLPQ